MSSPRRLGLLRLRRGAAPPSPFDCWWRFHQSSSDKLKAENSDSPDFNFGNDPFSVVTIIRNFTYTSAARLVNFRFANVGTDGFTLDHNASEAAFQIRQTGYTYRAKITYTYWDTFDEDILLAGVNEGATGNVHIYLVSPTLGTLHASVASGPMQAVTNDALEVVDLASDLRFYCIGIIPSALTQTDLENIYNELAHPADFSPVLYEGFCQDVGATLTAGIGTGPNAPYIFTVTGTPTKGP